MNAEAPVLKAKDAPNMSSFDWTDPFRLADQLTEDERMIQESARTGKAATPRDRRLCERKHRPRDF